MIYYMSSCQQKANNKFFNVFVGPPWTSNINTWPGINTNNNGTTISNYFKYPLPIIDPPDFPPQTPGGWTLSGGSKKRRSKKSRKSNKSRKSRKSRNSKKFRKYRKSTR